MRRFKLRTAAEMWHKWPDSRTQLHQSFLTVFWEVAVLMPVCQTLEWKMRWKGLDGIWDFWSGSLSSLQIRRKSSRPGIRLASRAVSLRQTTAWPQTTDLSWGSSPSSDSTAAAWGSTGGLACWGQPGPVARAPASSAIPSSFLPPVSQPMPPGHPV